MDVLYNSKESWLSLSGYFFDENIFTMLTDKKNYSKRVHMQLTRGSPPTICYICKAIRQLYDHVTVAHTDEATVALFCCSEMKQRQVIDSTQFPTMYIQFCISLCLLKVYYALASKYKEAIKINCPSYYNKNYPVLYSIYGWARFQMML